VPQFAFLLAGQLQRELPIVEINVTGFAENDKVLLFVRPAVRFEDDMMDVEPFVFRLATAILASVVVPVKDVGRPRLPTSALYVLWGWLPGMECRSFPGAQHRLPLCEAYRAQFEVNALVLLQTGDHAEQVLC
jgi:hypothetical protein